jgi:tetratricopeptide (TPR) repeat protein
MAKATSQKRLNRDHAIQIAPQRADAYGYRGLAYTQLKEYNRAVADFDRAIQLAPQLAEAYEHRGLVYIELKQYPQAKANLAKAAQLYQSQNNQDKYQEVMMALNKLGR